jgi:hypothetical protein
MIQVNLGNVSKTKKGKPYQAHFRNPITKEQKYLGVFMLEKEAEDFLNNYLIDFYSTSPFLLPKGIFVCTASRKFGYNISIKGKFKQIINSKSLKEVIDCRIEFINTLLF